MPELPARPDLEQLRHQAKDLLRAAKDGQASARSRIAAVSETTTLASAQLALAREYGFSSWPRLKTEVARREILDSRAVDRLRALRRARHRSATWRRCATTRRAAAGGTFPVRPRSRAS